MDAMPGPTTGGARPDTTTQGASGSSSRRTAQPPATGLVHWVPLVAFALLVLALARHARAGISDPDTLWHVLAGDHLWRTHQLIGPDPLSDFTTQPWILHQWLPDLGLALANQFGGLAAVSWVAQVGRLGVCLSLFVLCRRVAGPLPAVLAASAAFLGAADSLSPRPQLVGFVFLVVTIGAWWRTADDLRPRWWLIATTWVWACCHGTWIIGVAVGGTVIAGLALESLVARRTEPGVDARAGRRLERRDLVRLVLLAVGCLGAATFTPVGPRLWQTFVTIRAVSPYIEEWRHPTLSTPSVVVTAVLVVAIPLLWLIARRPVRWVHVGLYVLGVASAATTMRTVAVGAIILAPLAALGLQSILGTRAAPTAGENRLVAISAAGSLVLAAVLAASGPAGTAVGPNALRPQLDALPPNAVVYNTDSIGGWLLWTQPDLRVTADTRAELYGGPAVRSYLRTMQASPGWEAGFDHFAPAAALLEDDAPLAKVLQRERDWVVVGSAAGYQLLEPAAR